MSQRRGRKSPWIPPGVLAVWKPVGPTSHDLVDLARSVLPRRAKVGHAGTLDPFAEGVLPLCLGGATRLADAVGEGEKVYWARASLDRTTDSADHTGAVTGEFEEPPDLSLARVREAAATLVGEIEQRPPAYSAVRVDGQRAYDRARKGEDFEVPTRKVQVHAFEVLAYAWPEVELRVRCGRGTYIRSLARDLGAALGAGGTLLELVRERVGAFDRARCVTPFQLISAPAIQAHFVPLEDLLDGHDAGAVDPGAMDRLLSGNPLEEGLVSPPGTSQGVVLYPQDSALPVAIGRRDGRGRILPRRVFGLPATA